MMFRRQVISSDAAINYSMKNIFLCNKRVNYEFSFVVQPQDSKQFGMMSQQLENHITIETLRQLLNLYYEWRDNRFLSRVVAQRPEDHDKVN